MGWKYMLWILGFLVSYVSDLNIRLRVIDLPLQTLAMFLGRVVFFRLHESPRYLVHAGRPQDAVDALQRISEFNGDRINIGIRDVEDRRLSLSLTSREASQTHDSYRNSRVSTDGQPYYQSTSISSAVNIPETSDRRLDSVEEAETERLVPSDERKNIPHHISSGVGSSKGVEIKWTFLHPLPGWMKNPIAGWLDRLAVVLSKEWRTTTLLVWCIWFALSLGVFNQPI